MLTFIRRLRWNAKHREELASCMDYVHGQHFPSLNRGNLLMDGMSADASVFLHATVRSIAIDGLRVRVNYSVKYKATVDAIGSYHLLHSDGTTTELSHVPRDC